MWSADMPHVVNVIFFYLNITASILQCLYSLTCTFTICMNICELCYDMSALESNLLTANELLDLNYQRIISSGNIKSWQRPQRSYSPSCHQNGNPPFTFSHNRSTNLCRRGSLLACSHLGPLRGFSFCLECSSPSNPLPSFTENSHRRHFSTRPTYKVSPHLREYKYSKSKDFCCLP